MKAKVTKPDGTVIELDGTPGELQALGLFWTPISMLPFCSPMPTVGCQHEYPTPWLGTTPPPCSKCGQLALLYSPTCSAGADVTLCQQGTGTIQVPAKK